MNSIDQPKGELVIQTIAMPKDTNRDGDIFGGWLVSQMDLGSAILAGKIAKGRVVTVAIDYMNFISPIKIGQLVMLRSSVNRVFRTSMEVGVKVMVEDLRTGAVRHTSSAYLTFVAIDAEGNRIEAPPVIPETDEEKRRYQEAGRRREQRLRPPEPKSSRIESLGIEIQHRVVELGAVRQGRCSEALAALDGDGQDLTFRARSKTLEFGKACNRVAQPGPATAHLRQELKGTHYRC